MTKAILLFRILLLSLCCVMLMAIVPTVLVEDKELPYSHWYIGSWNEFDTQYPYTFDTIEIIFVSQDGWHDLYTIRIIRSVEQLDEFSYLYSLYRQRAFYK